MNKLSLLLASAIIHAVPVAAATISIFNTGVDAMGVSLPLGADDPHWQLISGSGITVARPASVLTQQSPFGVYAQNPNSRWIWVAANGTGATGSPYTFRQTFDLTGLDPSTAVITGS